VSVVVDREGVETRVVHDLVDFDGARVLEVGCGDGRLTWRYAGEAAEVLAIDVGEQKIMAAIDATPPELGEKVIFRAVDINDLEGSEDDFDVAILSYSL